MAQAMEITRTIATLQYMITQFTSVRGALSDSLNGMSEMVPFRRL